MIKALIVDQADDDSVSAGIHKIEASQLPDDGEVDIAVEYSTINYKDCLLYTSDAADDMQCVDLGGRRIIKKKKQ